MENISTIKYLFDEITTVEKDTHYWLVRTMGGDFFYEYLSRGYIAIGYNEITLNEIKFASTFGEKAGEQLKKIVEAKEALKKQSDDEDEINAQYATTQLLKFYRDIQIGDVIVIPGRNSDDIAFAKIESGVYEEPNVSKLEGVCNFAKRRKIHLLHKTTRTELNPKLQLMFNSRHIVSNVDGYASYIDSSISDFYAKDGYTNLVLRVREEDNLRASDFGLVPALVELVKDFSEENKLEINTDDIKAKMCVQSPGDILMFATSWEGITLIGLFILLLKSGELSYSKESGFKIKVGDILRSASEFLDRRRDRKFKKAMQDKLENMKIETPKDLTAIMKEFNDKRESY
jgi:restriction system protein